MKHLLKNYPHFSVIWSVLLIALIASFAVIQHTLQTKTGGVGDPSIISNLISFWDFQEDAGQNRVAKKGFAYSLQEGNGPIVRVNDGVFGPYSAFIDFGQWLVSPRAESVALDIHGNNSVTIVAWIKRMRKPDQQHWGEFIAGIWDENGKRQYGLFLNLDSTSIKNENYGLDGYGYGNQVNGHVSYTGGATPGYKWNRNASFSASTVAFDQWQCVAMSYDGTYSRAYINGVFEPRPHINPLYLPQGLYDGGVNGSNFYVGADPVPGFGMINLYKGLLGGLAIYNRALTNDEIKTLASFTPSGW
jgi:hypothetical protein